MQLFLCKDVNDEVRLGEEDSRLYEGNGLVATVTANNHGKMDTVFHKFLLAYSIPFKIQLCLRALLQRTLKTIFKVH